ncbi:hypothetical protein CsSME_00043203 [Camellia sinensis var. sinensis]
MLTHFGGFNSRAHHSSTIDTPNSAPAVHAVQSTDVVSSMSTFEFEDTLRHLLDRRTSSTPTSASSSLFAHSDNLVSSTSVFLSHKTLPWIIDSGASDHTTRSFDLFSEYKPYLGKEKVRIDVGIISSISRKGLIHLSSSLPLSSVLHVPSFSDNLLSLSHLTRDLNCNVIFFS